MVKGRSARSPKPKAGLGLALSMPRTSVLYRAFAATSVPLVPLLIRGARHRAAHRARLAAPADLARWARVHRDPTRPLVWFHAPSVGEGLQARAVIDALRAVRPDVQLVYTHFSPSAESLAASLAADWNGYLCYDRTDDVERMLTAAAPDLLVFTKLDLWPELATRAAARGTRLAMAAATVSAASGRLKWPARQLVTPGYAALDLAMAVAADDAERLEYLGCPRDRIAVTGDPRVDSVLQVATTTPTDDLALPASDLAVTLVAGSTWPEDEAIVLAALARVRRRHPGARLIIAPHQPTATHLLGVDAIARRLGLPDPVRFSALGRGAIPAVIAVDRTGVLARLYGSGALAYVGGGWGRKGIHSVLEPAAWGRPIVIGPIDRDNRDVQMLEQRGALLRLSEPDGVTQLAEAWGAWLDHPADALVAGAAGRAALEEARGAATRSAEMLKQLLERR